MLARHRGLAQGPAGAGRRARIAPTPIPPGASAMDIQEQIAVIVHTISHQGGRIDALNATLLSMLHLAKSSPGLREAIEAQLGRTIPVCWPVPRTRSTWPGSRACATRSWPRSSDGAARRIHGRCPWPGPAAATRHSYPHLLWTSLGIVRVQPGKTLSLQALDRTAQQWRRPGARGAAMRASSRVICAPCGISIDWKHRAGRPTPGSRKRQSWRRSTPANSLRGAPELGAPGA